MGVLLNCAPGVLWRGLGWAGVCGDAWWGCERKVGVYLAFELRLAFGLPDCRGWMGAGGASIGAGGLGGDAADGEGLVSVSRQKAS